MVEIDLSEGPGELVPDEEAFAQEVLNNPANHRWINIGSASFLAAVTGMEIVQVMSPHAQEKVVQAQKGSLLRFKDQDALRYVPGEETPQVLELELADTV